MGAIFFISIILKGIGAVLEVVLQIVMTRRIGVGGYGTYSVWISSSELIFWCLFSALSKCNTYYLSAEGASISDFKRKYYSFYVLPTLLTISVISCSLKKPNICLICLISFSQLLVQDQSSTLMARRHSVKALFGEYVLGRAIFLACIAMLFFSWNSNLILIIILYLIQYVVVYLFFVLRRRGGDKKTAEIQVSLIRWGRYQRADFVQAMIGQVPVILQYIMVGDFNAGVVSVVLVVKKLVNFISGPTAKIFLPEFSRAYKQRENDLIQKKFASIMRIQMLFISPLSVILIGYPKVILRIFADDLVPYANIFILCASVFLVAASLGPCGGLMQMTGNEKMDNRLREIAVLAMIMVFVAAQRNSYFVFWGLCVQTSVESIGKYLFISRWMHKAPVPLRKYLSWWLFPILVIAVTYLFRFEQSFGAMVIAAVLVLLLRGYDELFRRGMLSEIRDMVTRRKNVYPEKKQGKK